jgi:hypothetical protein
MVHIYCFVSFAVIRKEDLTVKSSLIRENTIGSTVEERTRKETNQRQMDKND